MDIFAAALALYVLIPSADLNFATFLPVFLLALGAAMLSGAPGGVGPFELTLISMLPQVATPDIVCAIVTFRALYYAVPAVLAVAVIFTAKQFTSAPFQRQTLPHNTTAELGILAQNGGTVVASASSSIAVWKTTQTATQLFDPVSGSAVAALETLNAEAKAHNRLPCLYKCGPKMAMAARRQGWQVARIAQDCILPLASYDLEHSARRGLRRKLRKAQRAGVKVIQADVLPDAEMTALDAAWQDVQGPARGGTMGRFCPDYLHTQDVYLAYQNGKLIAFASFHEDTTSLCLDLMRHGPAVPDGTMHLIVQTAIASAQAAGKSRLSLAAVPDMSQWIIQTKALRGKFTNPGLAQFKNSFAPQHHPRYAAAPSRVALAIALADITAEVYGPRPLPPLHQTHKQDEDYEVALSAPP